MASVTKFLLLILPLHLTLAVLPPAGASRAENARADHIRIDHGRAEGAIDYGRPKSWPALPGLSSPAGLTPRGGGFSDPQAQARADLFYLHPTTGAREDVPNIPIDDAEALRSGQIMLTAQATAFNAVARIFGPRYRQMSLLLYERGEEGLQAPMNRAYEDVRRAFAHYVAHHNRGRPFFILAHSYEPADPAERRRPW